MQVLKIGSSSIVFDNEDKQFVFPMNSIFLISNDDSEIINVRLKASRKNILQFSYKDVSNISAQSANEMVNKISELIN